MGAAMDGEIGVVTGGTVATESGVFRADVLIRDGRIVGLVEDAADLPGRRVDAAGKVIFPGALDIHTHLREPSKIEREGFSYGTAAAAAGGITTVAEMPQADPLVTDVASFRLKRELASQGSIADFGLFAAAVGQGEEALAALQREGALAFKAFLCESSPGYPRLDDAALLETLRQLRDLDALLIVHAENDEMLRAGLARMAAAGRTDPLAHAESRPPIVEIEAIRRAVHLATYTGTRLHVAHVSTADGVQAVVDGRRAGAAVTCETCPQYLVLDTTDLERLGPYARCAPALRERSEVEALWQQVLAGHVDAIVSDHSPYRYEEKDVGMANIFEAKLGLNIIQTMLPAVVDEGVHRRGLTLPQFASLTAAGPARLLGLYPRKGTVQVGADADLTIWDLDAEWEVKREELFSRHRWTPLEGRRLKGRVVATIRRGELIYADGKVSGRPGSGRFLGRGYGVFQAGAGADTARTVASGRDVAMAAGMTSD